MEYNAVGRWLEEVGDVLISNSRISETVIELLERLSLRQDLPQDVTFELGIAAGALAHSHAITLSHGDEFRAFSAAAKALLTEMGGEGNTLADMPAGLEGDAAKQAFNNFLVRFESTLALVDSTVLAAFTQRLLALNASLAMPGMSHEGRDLEVSPGVPLTEENLGIFLREALGDPSARVSNINVLPGGFGKETTLFSVVSEVLTTDLVLRRDTAINVFNDLECHIAETEFQLLKAVFARGFPAPEPLWLGHNSAVIQGPSFTIMRRAPGAVVGSAISGSDRVAPALQQTLAQIVARLHNVPPLTELAAIPAFRPELWKQSAGTCTRTYIRACYDNFLDSAHLPLPAMHGLFNWLLVNIPDADVSPTLIHGDIGFHNLLFHNGELSAILDWEFGHIGDPAEDLGYIRSIMGNQLDWPDFIAAYAAVGRPLPSEQRIRFFEIWSHVRNAAASVMMVAHFEAGRLRSPKLCALPMSFVPHFIGQAAALIARYGDGI